METEDITSLFFKPVSGKKYKYVPGQYVNARPESVSGHGKAYTLSGTPDEKNICLTIKRKGEISSALINMPIGEKLKLEGPFGNFYPGKEEKDIVMLAGGIGITPFYSIIKSKLATGFDGKILLFYSNKNMSRAPFANDLIELSKENSIFKVVFCLTEEKTKRKSVKEYSRINAKMLEKYVASLKNKCYYICGSIGFVDDMWKMLKSTGIKEEFIFTESFF